MCATAAICDDGVCGEGEEFEGQVCEGGSGGEEGELLGDGFVDVCGSEVPEGGAEVEAVGSGLGSQTTGFEA